jgi:hypothetical protein
MSRDTRESCPELRHPQLHQAKGWFRIWNRPFPVSYSTKAQQP